MLHLFLTCNKWPHVAPHLCIFVSRTENIKHFWAWSVLQLALLIGESGDLKTAERKFVLKYMFEVEHQTGVGFLRKVLGYSMLRTISAPWH